MDDVIIVDGGIYLLEKYYFEISELTKDTDIIPFFTFKTDQYKNKYNFWRTTDQTLIKKLYLKFAE